VCLYLLPVPSFSWGMLDDPQTSSALGSPSLSSPWQSQEQQRILLAASDDLPSPVAPETPTPVPPLSSTPDEPQPVPPNGVEVPTSQQPPEGTAEEAERPKSKKSIIGQQETAVLLRAGGILLPKGYLQIQPTVEYTRFSTNRVAISGLTIFEAIIIGAIRVDRVDREIVTTTAALRYGLWDRVQLEARIPYVFRRDREILSVGTNEQREVVTDGNNLGDLEGTLIYQPVLGSGYIPNVLVRVRGKSRTGKDAFDISTERVDGRLQLTDLPTGTGFWAVSPGFTSVWRSDPLVLFAGGDYIFRLKRDVGGDFGTVDPGDGFDFFFGFNLALNERIGFNISFLEQFTFKTKVNGIEQDGTDFNDARLTFGTSISALPNLTVLLSASVGLTRESPDFSLNLSLPITMQLFDF